jgi:PqqD family protein of HPr-rel-A system
MSVTTERPLRRPDVWLRQAEGENVVYDPKTGAVHLLNATALAIWELCDGETTVEEMVSAICGLSGLPRDVVDEDVGRILEEFGQARILVREG